MVKRFFAVVPLVLLGVTPAQAATYPPTAPPQVVLAEVTPDGALIALTGWKPHSNVRISWDRLEGRGFAAGRISGRVSVEVNRLGRAQTRLPLTIPGAYRVMARGFNVANEDAAITLFVEVPCDCATPEPEPEPATVAPEPEPVVTVRAEPSLAATGFRWGGWLVSGLLLIALGVLMRSRR